jgi:hypothetical protein
MRELGVTIGGDMHLVRLIDGSEVSSDSEEYRHECEARAIAALPSTLERRTWIEDIERRRGVIAASLLRQTIAQLWELRSPAENGRIQPAG